MNTEENILKQLRAGVAVPILPISEYRLLTGRKSAVYRAEELDPVRKLLSGFARAKVTEFTAFNSPILSFFCRTNYTRLIFWRIVAQFIDGHPHLILRELLDDMPCTFETGRAFVKEAVDAGYIILVSAQGDRRTRRVVPSQDMIRDAQEYMISCIEDVCTHTDELSIQEAYAPFMKLFETATAALNDKYAADLEQWGDDVAGDPNLEQVQRLRALG